MFRLSIVQTMSSSVLDVCRFGSLDPTPVKDSRCTFSFELRSRLPTSGLPLNSTDFNYVFLHNDASG
jgi:hypothetical protein